MTVSSGDGQTMRSSDRYIVAGLVALCLLIYTQVYWFAFINFDDNLYVFDNPFVKAGLTAESIKWAFTTFHSANWHPLTWLSHMLDVNLFQANPGAHHFVNVVFHAASSVVAFFAFRKLTGDTWKSAVVAFLFAVHPAHVESVAWVSERKDVLSTLCWLLAMLSYARFARIERDSASAVGRMMSRSMLLVILFVALGLMAKPMLVTLPFVLLLLDYWPLGRLNKTSDLSGLIIEKLPLFVLVAISSYVTVLAQGSYGAIQSINVLPLDVRVLNAIVSYAKYIVTMFYPVNLGINYPYVYPLPVWQIAASGVLLIAITAICVWQRRERKYLLVGWLWFVGTMVPVIGLVQVGAQAMADRYTYVPYFGLFVMVVWGAAEVIEKWKLNFASTAVAAAVPIAVLTFVAFNQTSYWKNGNTLYAHTLGAGQGNFLTMHNYCSLLTGQQRYAEAEPWCKKALEADPGFTDSYNLLGVIDVRTGRNEEAVVNFRKALELQPRNLMALENLAAPLAMLGKPDEAEKSLDAAAEIHRTNNSKPASLASSYANLAAVYAKQKRFDKAADTLKTSLDIDPRNSDARANYALSLSLLGKLSEARPQIEQSIGENPNQPISYNVYGLILMQSGDASGAVPQFEKALQLKPDFKEARDNLDKVKRTNAGK